MSRILKGLARNDYVPREYSSLFSGTQLVD